MTPPGAGGFDPDIDAWLRARALDPTAADTSVAGARVHSRAVNARSRALLRDPARPASETEAALPVGAAAVAARVYRPADDRPVPTIVFCHGGGWIAGDLDTHAQHARRLCVEGGAVVLAVDYRLAPEHRFPAAFDDCFAATVWAGEHAGELGGDRGRLVVAGDSAGGQLAASVAIAMRDAGLPLAAQLLVSPVTDLLGGYADPAIDAGYPSRAGNAEGYGLTTAGMAEFVAWYGARAAGADWRASPLRAANLAGVAPAVIHAPGFDPLRDEGVAYARELAAAGVAVRHRLWPTLNHSYFALGGVSPAAEWAARQASVDLRDLLAG